MRKWPFKDIAFKRDRSETELRKPFKINRANWQLEKSNERKETEKNWLVFSKTFNFWISKKIGGLKLFKFVEQFIMDTFLLKLTQFEKTVSIGKTFISLGNLIINFIFEISDLYIFCSIVEFDFLLTIEMHWT